MIKQEQDNQRAIVSQRDEKIRELESDVDRYLTNVVDTFMTPT